MRDRREISVLRFGYPAEDDLSPADVAVLMGDKSAGRHDPDSAYTAPVHGVYGAAAVENRNIVPTGPFPDEAPRLEADAVQLGGVVAPQMIDVRSELI
jgi:hypothetical protein